jgi:hypothetical protein
MCLLAVTACIGTSDPTAPAVNVSLTLNRTSLRTVDTLFITVLGTNTSNVTIEVPNFPCLATVDIRNEQGEPVEFGDPRYCALPLYPPKVLAPGETWGDTVRILHPTLGQFRVRAGLPSPSGYVYSAFTSVTVRP